MIIFNIIIHNNTIFLLIILVLLLHMTVDTILFIYVTRFAIGDHFCQMFVTWFAIRDHFCQMFVTWFVKRNRRWSTLTNNFVYTQLLWIFDISCAYIATVYIVKCFWDALTIVFIKQLTNVVPFLQIRWQYDLLKCPLSFK